MNALRALRIARLRSRAAFLHCLRGAAIVAVLAGAATPARADEAAAAANGLLAAQLADVLTTREALSRPNTFERDPLAQPFVRNTGSLLAASIVTNAAARLLFRRAPAVLRVLTVLEGLAVVNNVGVIRKR